MKKLRKLSEKELSQINGGGWYSDFCDDAMAVKWKIHSTIMEGTSSSPSWDKIKKIWE